MKHAALAAIVLALAGATAQAQTAAVIAFTAKPVNLRAGPAREYPIVAVLPANMQVAVQGCLTDASWCDVVAGYDRGWVYAGNIAYPYQNQWQPMVSLAPLIGIAILGFAFDDYWHEHYWNRPWYPDRWRWERVRPPRYVPPRAAPRPADGWRPPPNWQPGRPGWNPAAPRRPGEHARPPGQVPAPRTVPPPAPAPAPRAMPPRPQPQPAQPRAVPSPRVQPQPQRPTQPRAQPQPRQGGQHNEHERR